MFIKNTKESYWNSYRLLENQLIKISHSIFFDDKQIDVYSTELADIISSACVKIESLAKDIYENHILPFQIDNDEIPFSYSGNRDKFKWEKWNRENWKFDYNCLIEIDKKFLISKKQILLKIEKFNFINYGSIIIPFANLEQNEKLEKCNGGKWEFSNHDIFSIIPEKLFKDIDWLKSYQKIKHNYAQSIKEHGTIKNALISLAGFYLLAIYNSYLPSKVLNNTLIEEYNLDFDSKIFKCGICNNVMPPFIVDSDYINECKILREIEDKSILKEVYHEQNLIDDIDSNLFCVILNKQKYNELTNIVNSYCETDKIKVFDISETNRKLHNSDLQYNITYQKIISITKLPYYFEDVKIAFNTSTKNIYDCYDYDYNDYELSKYRNRKAKNLSNLKIGDNVNIKLINDGDFCNCEIKSFNNQSLTIIIKNGDNYIDYTTPLKNVINIEKG